MAEELGYTVEEADKNRSPGRCFVCDLPVPGRYYSLASCRAQCSKIRLIEKLGTLVGDQYMVVISEDDIICRECASNMNTLDRFESEALSLRSTILKFLEKKYSLPDGELVDQKNTGLAYPSRLMSPANPAPNNEKKFTSSVSNNFMARKRRAALAESTSENTVDSTTNTVEGEKTSTNSWMQCGTCKYTTTYDSFKRHHLASSNSTAVVGGNILRDKNGMDEILDNGPSTSKRKARKISQQSEQMSTGFMKDVQFPDEMSQDGSQNEEISIVGTDLGTFSVDTTFDTNVNADDPETIKVQIVSQGQRKNYVEDNDVTIELSDLQDEAENSEMISDDVGDVCVLDEGGDEDVLKVAGPDGNTVYVQMIGEDKGVADVDSMRKQLLTVNEDGTLEMVEVLWDENEMRQGGEDDGEESPFQ